jgi:hypothetical protein
MIGELEKLRDQLAMTAMHACLSNPGMLPDNDQQLVHLAGMTYKMADAMLEARNK